MRQSGLGTCLLLALALGSPGCAVRVAADPQAPAVDRPADTTAWAVLWSDDFDRAEPGGSWKPVTGRWSVEGGALKGVFARDRAVPFEFYAADAAFQGEGLPETAQISYESWSPDEVGSEAEMLNGGGTRGLIVALYGTPHPALRARAAVVFLQAAAARFATAAANRGFAFRPGVRHKVRVVRQPEGVTAFVDGERVVSAAVGGQPGSGEPRLHLAGTFGKDGSVIYFDNVEIRVPPTPEGRDR